MTREDKQAVFNTARFFNKQPSGLRLADWESDTTLKNMLKPLATFVSDSVDSDRFVAIAEGVDMPIYAFTYGIEVPQFVFEDPTKTADYNALDHTIIARTHAQYIAGLIADEGRQCPHEFEGDVYESLLRHYNQVLVEYRDEMSDENTTMPVGMAVQEVYLLQ